MESESDFAVAFDDRGFRVGEFSPEDRAEIVRLHEEGRTPNYIASVMCRAVHTVNSFLTKHENARSASDALAALRRASYQELDRVTLPRTPFIGAARGLRQEPVCSRSLTAVLLGDPSPQRSALKRELRPDEYASGREGGYRDSRKPRRKQTASEAAAIAARFIRWREERRGKEG